MTAPRRVTCEELIEFLAAYVEGELAADERAAFDRHLSLCPDCVNYLDSYRETIRLGQAAMTESALAEQAPAELIDAILAARRRA
jgi:anti-sigma factor RsiW